MRRLRQILMLVTLLLTAALLVLCIVGAFLGARRASALFRSPPLVVFWVVFALLLLAGVIFFRSLRRSGGLLSIHVGALLVLVGGMVGSPAGHRLSGAIFGGGRVREGTMALLEGGPGSDMLRLDGENAPRQLPFTLRLERAWREYYPSRSNRWEFYAVADGPLRHEQLVCELGEPVTLPFSGAKMTLLEYIGPDKPGPRPGLLIATPDATEILPVRLGASVQSDLLGGSVRYLRAYENFRVGENAETEPVDRPGEGYNPALELSVGDPNADARQTVAFTPPVATFLAARMPQGGPTLMYLPEPRDDQDFVDAPAVKLHLAREGHSVKGWLTPGGPMGNSHLPLAMFYEDPNAWTAAGAPQIVLLPPDRQIRQYNARVAVLRDGEVVRRQTIQPNHPMHYAGYHVYLLSDELGIEDLSGAHFQLVSDRGVWPAWIGYVLLGGGIAWCLWVRPGPYARRKGGAA